VTPNARLAASGQLDCAGSRLDSLPTCPCTSMIPGMIVLPFTSMRRASDGTGTEPDGPTATMRLPSTSTVASSITPGVPLMGPGFRPPIVMTRAPTRASDPDGLSVGTRNPIGSPFDSGSRALRAAAPACAAPLPTNGNVSARSRE
jgi:hypothetical protein